ncbi:DUF2971 domain-containing protein [Litorimonas sp. WD9-15]|uniref:DUF2971 domain-containing protein n=1 Tax=Litorimonas sp. WD9-15 TaxID=3418716 RepID=UPI003D03C180
MGKIYKYFSHEMLEIVFARDEYCGIKCSFPKDYNDPFELFLSIDLSVDSNLLAFYNDVVQDIPQLPTTCFSRSPIVTPMWAHYADNHTGFVLEFDTEALKDWSSEFRLEDVIYQEAANDKLNGLLELAAGTKKPRHSYFLLNAAIHTAYFTKLKEWSYERETRLVADPEAIETIGGHQILFIPTDLITAIIVGPKFPTGKLEHSSTVAREIGAEWYQLNIGKSSITPYLKCANNDSFVFSDGSIENSPHFCSECEEPIDDRMELCPWCRITDEENHEASQTNPFRILDAHDLLDEYFANADKVGK